MKAEAGDDLSKHFVDFGIPKRISGYHFKIVLFSQTTDLLLRMFLTLKIMMGTYYIHRIFQSGRILV